MAAARARHTDRPWFIRVNSISPGPVATDLWLGAGGVAETIAATAGTTAGSVADAAAAQAVTGRFTRPQEVAAIALFLNTHVFRTVCSQLFPEHDNRLSMKITNKPPDQRKYRSARHADLPKCDFDRSACVYSKSLRAVQDRSAHMSAVALLH